GQRQIGVLPRGNGHMHLWRQVLQQKGQRLVNRLGIDQVIVVEDQYELIPGGGDVIDEGGQDRFDGRGLRGFKGGQYRRPDFRRDRLHGRDEVSQKAARFAIAFIEGQPRDRPASAFDPLANQRRFPETGGSRNDGHSALQAPVQPFDQPGTRDKGRAGLGGVEFGG